MRRSTNDRVCPVIGRRKLIVIRVDICRPKLPRAEEARARTVQLGPIHKPDHNESQQKEHCSSFYPGTKYLLPVSRQFVDYYKISRGHNSLPPVFTALAMKAIGSEGQQRKQQQYKPDRGIEFFRG